MKNMESRIEKHASNSSAANTAKVQWLHWCHIRGHHLNVDLVAENDNGNDSKLFSSHNLV
jgi:hypothetical protein